jgi:cell division septum initiation protein DivIVA
MTTEHPLPAARDAGVENLFETVFKGYAKRQVEDYIAWLQEQVSAAKAELTDARRELATARDDLVETRAQLQTRPAHEEISVRMAQILRLAEEEAQQERDAGAQQAASVLEQARGEARAALEAAHANAADIVRAARRECDDDLAAARAEANRLVETARRQAEGTMADARERAQRALADADRRTEQITTLQQRRLAAVLSAHEDVVRRLEAARGVIGEILVQDGEQGDPAAAIDPTPLPAAGPAVDPTSVQLPSRPSPEAQGSSSLPMPPAGPQVVSAPPRPQAGPAPGSGPVSGPPRDAAPQSGHAPMPGPSHAAGSAPLGSSRQPGPGAHVMHTGPVAEQTPQIQQAYAAAPGPVFAHPSLLAAGHSATAPSPLAGPSATLSVVPPMAPQAPTEAPFAHQMSPVADDDLAPLAARVHDPATAVDESAAEFAPSKPTRRAAPRNSRTRRSDVVAEEAPATANDDGDRGAREPSDPDDGRDGTFAANG